MLPEHLVVGSVLLLAGYPNHLVWIIPVVFAVPALLVIEPLPAPGSLLQFGQPFETVVDHEVAYSKDLQLPDHH